MPYCCSKRAENARKETICPLRHIVPYKNVSNLGSTGRIGQMGRHRAGPFMKAGRWFGRKAGTELRAGAKLHFFDCPFSCCTLPTGLQPPTASDDCLPIRIKLKLDLNFIYYRLFFKRSIAQYFTQIYLNCFVSSQVEQTG